MLLTELQTLLDKVVTADSDQMQNISLLGEQLQSNRLSEVLASGETEACVANITKYLNGVQANMRPSSNYFIINLAHLSKCNVKSLQQSLKEISTQNIMATANSQHNTL